VLFYSNSIYGEAYEPTTSCFQIATTLLQVVLKALLISIFPGGDITELKLWPQSVTNHSVFGVTMQNKPLTAL
jgi:hypothetical protein